MPDETEKILIVDDMAAGLKTLSAALSDKYTVYLATNGEAALRLAAEKQPDIILLDIMMPGMDGFEVCRRLKQNRSLADVPVIMISALDEVDDEINGLQAGAIDFITKPYNMGLVRLRVHNHLELRQQKRLMLSDRKALEEERQRLTNVIEGTRAGSWEWDLRTGEIIINERWAELLGYRLGDIYPMTFESWKSFCHPDDLIQCKELLEEHFRGELAYYHCEVRMQHKNGNWVWLLSRGKIATRDDTGKPIMMCGRAYIIVCVNGKIGKTQTKGETDGHHRRTARHFDEELQEARRFDWRERATETTDQEAFRAGNASRTNRTPWL